MKPKIEQTTFGSITIKGEVYEHDVIIRLNGEVKKRCRVEMLPSQEAIHAWNKVKGSVVSMFHVTC